MSLFFCTIRLPPTSTLFPYTTLFRSLLAFAVGMAGVDLLNRAAHRRPVPGWGPLGCFGQHRVLDGVRGVVGQVDRKSTRLNSSHVEISYAVFCLKKKKKKNSAGVGAC